MCKTVFSAQCTVIVGRTVTERKRHQQKIKKCLLLKGHYKHDTAITTATRFSTNWKIRLGYINVYHMINSKKNLKSKQIYQSHGRGGVRYQIDSQEGCPYLLHRGLSFICPRRFLIVVLHWCDLNNCQICCAILLLMHFYWRGVSVWQKDIHVGNLPCSMLLWQASSEQR